MTEILTDWVHHHARHRPDSVALALIETGTTVTWAELDRRVDAPAGLLRDEWGVGLGDRAVAENDLRMMEVQFACMRIGAIFMPLNWRLAAPELAAQLADAEPHVVLHDGTWSGLVDELLALYPMRHRGAWDAPGVGVDYEAALAAATPVPGGDLDPDAVTHLLYTSGTTGRPKGVLCTNRTLVTQAHNLAHSSRVSEPDRHHLNIVPLFHAGGLNVFTNPVLYWGGRVSTVRRFDATTTLDLLTDPALAVTHLCGVLQQYEWLVRLEAFPTARFPTLQTVLYGGWGASTHEIRRAFRDQGTSVQLSYGASELGPSVSVMSRPDDAAADAGSSGTIMRYTRVRLTDGDGHEVPRDEVGELWVCGSGVTPGYWRQPRDQFFDGDWFRTGDAARLDERGHLHFVSRIREMYRSGGENVYPAEVEAVFAELPGVADLTVVGVPDERWGETGLLVVVLEPGATLTLTEVQEFAAGRLARFKQPAHPMVLDDMPRSATDKISRVAVRAQFLAAGASV